MRKPNQRSPLRYGTGSAQAAAPLAVAGLTAGCASPSAQSLGPVPRVAGSFGADPVITIPNGNPLSQGLGGLPVGSRVLPVIPPSMATALVAMPPYVSGTDTLVLVTDIVAALEPSR